MKWIRALLPLLLLLGGVAALVLLVMSRPAPAKKAPSELGTLVVAEPVAVADHDLTIEAKGSVLAAKTLVVQTEVPGRILWHHEELVPGGRVAKGQTLVRVDAQEYRLAAEQHEANVEQAELQLKVERMQQELAKDEWQIIGEDANATELGRSLALRKPQLEAAKAGVAAAKSAQARAQLSVRRTSVAAPFNAWVQSENVETGQLVSPQSPLATLIGTDAYWIQVSLPADKLGAFDIPGFNAQQGATATVVQDIGGNQVIRRGSVVRLYGDLDPVGRMARVLVEVPDPLGLDPELKHEGAKLPLLLGAYVKVKIDGHAVARAIEIPRTALRDGSSVYLLAKNNRLEIRPVKVLWRKEDTVLVSDGLAHGDRIVTSRIGAPLAGMLLRVAEADMTEAPVVVDSAAGSKVDVTASPGSGTAPQKRSVEN